MKTLFVLQYSFADLLLTGIAGIVLGIIIQAIWEAFASEETDKIE